MPCTIKPLEPAMQSASKGSDFPLTLTLEPHDATCRVTFSHEPNGALDGGPPYIDMTATDISADLVFSVSADTTATSITIQATSDGSMQTAQVIVTA